MHLKLGNYRVIIVEDHMTFCYMLNSWYFVLNVLKVEILLWRCSSHLYFFVAKVFVTILIVLHYFPLSTLVLSTIAKFVTLCTTAKREMELVEICTWCCYSWPSIFWELSLQLILLHMLHEHHLIYFCEEDIKIFKACIFHSIIIILIIKIQNIWFKDNRLSYLINYIHISSLL